MTGWIWFLIGIVVGFELGYQYCRYKTVGSMFDGLLKNIKTKADESRKAREEKSREKVIDIEKQ